MSMQSDDSEEMNEINMTPLVDVMMVLLIIFIITVPVLTHSVQVELPQANQHPTEIKPDAITVSVQRDGTLLWNEHSITLEALHIRFKTEATRHTQPEVRIQGDKKVEYEKVVQVMAAAQRAGLEKLGFITEPIQ